MAAALCLAVAGVGLAMRRHGAVPVGRCRTGGLR